MGLTLIYMIIGYVLFFGGTTLIEKGEMQWIAVGSSVLFLILALYHITREYDKEHAEIKRL